ncbi:MAG: BglG family transcription antiterminator [Lysinibacillus sp.]
MVLNHRALHILNKVIHAHSYISAASLQAELSISQRTLYYDVEKINDWLKQNGFSPLTYVRKVGYSIQEAEKIHLQKHVARFTTDTERVFSPEERLALISILILTREHNITLQDLLETLNVSRSTLLADIAQLKAVLRKNDLTLSFTQSTGYYIRGPEQNKRTVLLNYLVKVSNTQLWADNALTNILASVNDLNSIKTLDLLHLPDMMDDLEKSLGLKYTEDVHHSLTLHLYMLIKRFNRGRFISIDPIEKEIIHPTKEYKAAAYIAERIEIAYGMSLPEDEVYYLTTFFLSAKRNNSSSDEYEQEELRKLKQLVTLMVDDFQKFSCVFFRNRSELEQNLFTHLKPAYYRLKYGIIWDNPIAESVKETYKDLFILTKKVIHHFEYFLGKPVSDDEIAYIAIHFGGWLSKEGMQVKHRKKAIIVCASGVGTSRILQKQIEDLFPSIDIIEILTVRDYEKRDIQQIDYIFSTVHLKNKSIPIHKVNPILKPSEKAALLKQIDSREDKQGQMDIEDLIRLFKKHGQIKDEQALYQDLLTYQAAAQTQHKEVDQKPMLHDLLTSETIQITNEKLSWQKALQVAAQPLLDGCFIEQAYVEAMIQGVKKLGPYVVIAPGIALPHARPEDGVHKVGMSFLKLNQPCAFSEKKEHQVTLLFVLAAVDNEEHLKALSQLSILLSDAANIEQFNKAETVNEVLSIIQQNSK